MSEHLGHSLDEVLLGFTRALRAAGVPVTHDRSTAFLSAVALVGAGAPRPAYLAGRATLCASPDDLGRYDQVFEAWFGAREGLPRVAPREQPRTIRAVLPSGEPSGTGESDPPELVRAAASDAEVLQHRDIATLSPDEKALLDAMIRLLRPRLPHRRASRRTPWRRGQVDLQRTLRATLSQMGEPGRVRHRRRGTRARRVVVLVDVSASMRPYADALLRLAHVLVTTPGDGRRSVEVFTLGTRLTRVTRALRAADPGRAVAEAGEQVPDWSGGTRLGETLRSFLDGWSGLARGAVVVVLSDGWERGDAALLGEQAGRLSRLARRVVWLNPHRGKEGYAPVQQGVRAVLPHIDDFVAGHSLRSFAEVLEVIAGA